MKRSLTILFLLGLASWSNEREEPSILLFERNGIFYEYASKIPFDGKVITEFQSHSENASVQQIYKKGKLYVEESFFADGMLMSRDFYKNGKLHGTSTTYWGDGEKIRSKLVYIDDLVVVWEEWGRDGKFKGKYVYEQSEDSAFDATMGIDYDFLKYAIPAFSNFSKQQEDLLRDLLTSPGPLKIKDGPFP